MTKQRQDLHIHTKYSDGRIIVREAAERANTLNLEVIALTDHFWPSIGSQKGGMNVIQRRRTDIEDARNEFPSLKILDGVEVDITLDGQLEPVAGGLDQFDIIIGSIHYPCDSMRWERTLTRVLEKAKFDILGHWDGYLENFRKEDGESVASVLAEKNIAVELSLRYECQWEYFLEIARDQGCKFSLGSDAHWVDSIGRLEKQRQLAKGLNLPLVNY